MCGFLYMVSGASKNDVADIIDEYNLGYAFDAKRPPIVSEVHRGLPDGKPGIIIANPYCVDDKLVSYKKDVQNWTPYPGTDKRIHIGEYTEDALVPTATSLLKPLVIDGTIQCRMAKLGNGELWAVPIAKLLPDRAFIGDDGRWHRGEVASEYRYLWKIAQDFYDTIASSGGVDDINDNTHPMYIDMACSVLSCTHFISRVEASMMGLFGYNNFSMTRMVLYCMSDHDALNLILSELSQKKTEAEKPETNSEDREAST